MATIKTNKQLLSELRAFITAYLPQLDVSDGSIANDFILQPNSVAGEGIMQEIRKAIDLQLVGNLAGGDLDNEGTNYGKYRLPGVKAVGKVIFYSTTEPTTDIQIPIGTKVATAGTGITPAVTFVATETVFMLYSQRAAYYNPETGWWEMEVSIEAENYGQNGNVAEGKIQFLLTTISGINGVVSREATRFGDDLEPDSRLRKRIVKKMLGREIGVKNGIEAFLLDNIGFSDVLAILPNDPDSERVGGTDLFVIDPSSEQMIQAETYFAAMTDYRITYPPVLQVSSVTGATAGVLVPIADYEVIRDVTGIYRFSPLADEYLRLTALGKGKLTEGESLVIVYNRPSMVYEGWDLIRNPANLIVFAAPVIKKGIEWLVEMEVTVSFFANVDSATEKTNIENALIEFFDQYELGLDIDQSDIEITIQTGFGDYPISSVDQVVVHSFQAVSEFGEIRTPVNEKITLDQKGFARFGSIVFS